MIDTNIETIDDLAVLYNDKRPEIQEDAITLPESNNIEQPPLSQSGQSVPVDLISQADLFNPEIHRSNKKGKPILNKDGSYRLKSGKGSPKFQEKFKNGVNLSISSVNIPHQKTEQEKQNTENLIKQQKLIESASTANAMIVSTALFGASVALMGDEWVPDDDDKQSINEAFKVYFMAKGCDEIAPEWAILGGLAMYGLKRLDKPKTQSRLSILKEKIKGVFKKRNKKSPPEHVAGRGLDSDTK